MTNTRVKLNIKRQKRIVYITYTRKYLHVTLQIEKNTIGTNDSIDEAWEKLKAKIMETAREVLTQPKRKTP